MATVRRIVSFGSEISHRVNQDESSANFFPPYLFIKSQNDITVVTDIHPDVSLTGQRCKIIPTTSSTLTVLRQGKGHFYLVEQFGHVQSWYHHSGHWSLHGEFNLCGNQDTRVDNIILHDRTIYWCETSNNKYNICKRSLPFVKERLNDSTIGSLMTLLTEGPQCDFYTVANKLIIWPRSPCPPGMYMKWCPDQSKMEFHVLGKGCVANKEIMMFSEPVSFSCVSMLLVAAWSQPNPLAELHCKVLDPTDSKLHVICKSGQVCVISSQSETSAQYHLKVPCESACDWLVYDQWLVMCDNDKLSFFDLHTGGHCYDVDISSHGQYHSMWSNPGTVQTAGFITSTGVYQLQVDSKVPKRPDEALKETSSFFQKDRVAGDITELLKVSTIQDSPGLIIPLAHKIEKLRNDAILKQPCQRKCNQYSSGLNQLVSSHVKTYWDIQENINDLFDDRKNHPEVKLQTIKDEISSILNPSTSSDMESRRAYLELLAKEFPTDVLECLLEYLEFGTDNVSDSVVDKWHTVVASETAEVQTTFPLFEVLVRLMFIHQPNILIKFLTIAQHFCERTAGASAFSRKKLVEHALCQRALDCLPCSNKSVSLEGAILCKAQLILKRGDNQSYIKALRLLHDHGLWEAGLGLLKHIHKNTGIQNELFHVLVCSTVKNGVFARYNSEIMQLMPKSFNINVLLDLIEDNVPYKEIETLFVEKDDTTSIPFDCLRSHLLEIVKDQ